MMIKLLIPLFVPLMTHKLAKISFMTKVRASAVITLFLVFGFKKILPSIILNPELHFEALVLGSTFVGMADASVFKDYEFLIIGFIFSLVMHLIAPFIHGPGGILGFLALSSTIIYYYGKVLLKQK